MRFPLKLILAVLAALAVGGALSAAAGAQTPAPAPTPTPRLVVDSPQKRTLIREGQAGRMLMAGAWYFRLDDARTGRFQRQRSLRGWTRVSVPHNWNAKDTVLNKSSVGWYRKEFRLSRRQVQRGTAWKLRFESANHSAIVYLNGREIGRHSGGYLPFEVNARPKAGRNRLVVRVSTLRGANDLTHWRVARFNGYGTGGWWNFGGLLREVYLRPVRGVDIEHMAVLPRLKTLRGSARVITRLQLRNMARRRQTIRVALKLGRRTVATARPSIAGGRRRSVRVVFNIRNPKLWQPGRPALYKLTASASNEGGRSRYGALFGVKHLQRTASGLALLNGRVMNLRGASIHEDEPNKGAAWDAGLRRAHLNYLKSLGATVTRAHYPLHPAFMEALDRAGILFWAQAPVYQVRPEKMVGSVQRRAVQANRDTVNAGVNHPSIFTWSVANEISGEFANGAFFNETQGAYQAFIDKARIAVRRLDPTRWIGIDRQSVLGQPDPSPAIRRLDVIGANEYFGWYRASEVGRPSRTIDLGPFLDRTHQLYPGKPIFITEYGAESNRNGGVNEPGTFQFQNKWTVDHLNIHASRPYVNGSILWALRDFRVHPTWGGGNPKPNPPWNNKGLLDENGATKPVWPIIQRNFRATRPFR
jgi:beta-galactosidase/beta-glucuronidase